MSEYRLKTPQKVEKAAVGTYRKIEDTVVGAYKKVEETVVGAYQKVEDGVVGSYIKVEQKFVGAFLEKTDRRAQDGIKRGPSPRRRRFSSARGDICLHLHARVTANMPERSASSLQCKGSYS